MSLPSTPVLAEIVKRLRDTCPTLEKRVGGTAAFEAASAEGADLLLPHAWVLPMADVPASRTNMGVAQPIVETFGVMLCVDNKVNRASGLGLVASDELRAIRQELFDALLPWAPHGASDKVAYRGGRHVSMNRARLWHQYDFGFTFYVGGEVEEPPVGGGLDYIYGAGPFKAVYARFGLDTTMDVNWNRIQSDTTLPGEQLSLPELVYPQEGVK